ncbi:hypothetical protein SEA_SOOS_77 [Gordonia phage Soos]|nr:hypothetical protein SEA_SOOS_77 [Gordonia phage Soos]
MNVMKTRKRTEHLEALEQIRPFDGGIIRGEMHPNGLRVSLGELPMQWATKLSALDGPLFVVFSYLTPIAWRTNAGIVIPPVKYSATTTRHQNIVKDAWSL